MTEEEEAAEAAAPAAAAVEHERKHVVLTSMPQNYHTNSSVALFIEETHAYAREALPENFLYKTKKNSFCASATISEY